MDDQTPFFFIFCNKLRIKCLLDRELHKKCWLKMPAKGVNLIIFFQMSEEENNGLNYNKIVK